MKNKFYVTTPIYYATAQPHLGHLYSTVLADVAARFNKLQNKEIFFLTGTDEFGQKIEQAAQKVGKKPKEFVDSFIDNYKNTWKKFDIDYSKFIRTTDTDHIKAVQHWLQKLLDKGDIYKSQYEGQYCVPCETFVTEKNNLCPSCGRETVLVKEDCYFFKLSAYQDKLLEFYKKNPNFVTPKERLNEVVKFVESGLKDLSISRTTLTWGVPFPNDSAHVTYVWADALNNYITGIGYPNEGYKKWWPADLQVLGKDILRFHAIYWPAFLMASDIELPKKLLVHGWIKVGEQKMSKSLGNVVDPNFLYKQYGSDAVRYYLISQLSITQDSPFNLDDLEKKVNSDLVNNIGNLLNRTVQLCSKNEISDILEIKAWDESSKQLQAEFEQMFVEYKHLMENYSYHMAVSKVISYLDKVNAYFHVNEPWKLVKSDKDKFLEIVSMVCGSLKSTAVLLWPVMPVKMEKLLELLSINFDLSKTNLDEIQKNIWTQKYILQKGEILFEKIEIEKEIKEEVEKAPEINYINIDDFIKVDLFVGQVKECEEIEGSDKLLKMQVDFGQNGVRQILAGVKQYLKPEDLLNKKIVFVYNLKPRKMMGIESQGMMLTTSTKDGKLSPVYVDQSVEPGTRLK